MDKARELLDRFFCIPNVALYTFVVVMLSLCVGIVAVDSYTAKPAQHAPRNLPEGNTLLLR
jgi:hypothetical protein